MHSPHVDIHTLQSVLLSSIGPHGPKQTSITEGQTEANMSIWKAVEGTEAGVWEANVGSFTAIRDGHHEVCYLLSGKVTIESDNGDVRELGAGDLLVMPSGWQGVWHVHEPVRKVYVVVPAPLL
jgi:uncharacterized cupin superfamily protein